MKLSSANKSKSGQSIVGLLVALLILGLAGASMWSAISARFKGAKKDQVQAAMVALSQQVLSSLYNPDAYAFLDSNHTGWTDGNFQNYINSSPATEAANRATFYRGFTRYFVPMIPNPPAPGTPSRRDISCPTPPPGLNYDNQMCFGQGQTTSFSPNQRLDQNPTGCPAATCYDSAAYSNLYYTLDGNSCTRAEFQNANNKVCALRVDFRAGAFVNTANNFTNTQESDGARAWYLYAHYRISAKNLGPNMPAPIEVRNEALPGALVRSLKSSVKCNATNHLGIRAINPVTGETTCWNRPPSSGANGGLSCANNPDFAAPNADAQRVFAVGLEVAPLVGTLDEPSDTLRLRCVVATRVTCPAGYALQSFRVSKLRSDTLSDGDDDPARANEDRCVLIGQDPVPLKNGNCALPYVGDFTTVPPRCVAPPTGSTVSPNFETEADQ